MKIYQNAQYIPASAQDTNNYEKYLELQRQRESFSEIEQGNSTIFGEHTVSLTMPIQQAKPEQLFHNAIKKISILHSKNTVTIQSIYKK